MGEPTKGQEIALADSHGAVKAYFIIVHEPGKVPDKKRPPVPTHAGALNMLASLLHHRPSAELTLAQLTWDEDLWIEDGHAELYMACVVGGLDLPDGSIVTIRHSDRGCTVWRKAPGEKRARKFGGPYSKSTEAIGAICTNLWTEAGRRALSTGGGGDAN